jgi:hypothetical protein
MKDIRVTGNPSASPCATYANQNEGGRPRWKQIERVIGWIAKDGSTALMHEHAYVKNYSCFGDQSGECSYGCGPKHGSIVFDIGRTKDGRAEGKVLGPDHIYLLECVRDGGPYKYWDGRRERCGNLCDAIAKRDKAEQDMMAADAWIAGCTVNDHAAEPELPAVSPSNGLLGGGGPLPIPECESCHRTRCVCPHCGIEFCPFCEHGSCGCCEAWTCPKCGHHPKR